MFFVLLIYAQVKKKEMEKTEHGPNLICTFSDLCDKEVLDFFVLHLIILQQICLGDGGT